MDVLKNFGTSTEAEIEGTWVDLGEGAKIKVARMQSPRHRKKLDDLRKPYRSLLMSGRDLPDDVAEKIAIEAMADAILIDWSGIEYGGAPLPYSFENAVKLLQLRDFRDTVTFIAMQAETFREKAVAALEPSSPTRSGGTSTAKRT